MPGQLYLCIYMMCLIVNVLSLMPYSSTISRTVTWFFCRLDSCPLVIKLRMQASSSGIPFPTCLRGRVVLTLKSDNGICFLLDCLFTRWQMSYTSYLLTALTFLSGLSLRLAASSAALLSPSVYAIIVADKLKLLCMQAVALPKL